MLSIEPNNVVNQLSDDIGEYLVASRSSSEASLDFAPVVRLLGENFPEGTQQLIGVDEGLMFDDAYL